MKMSPPTKGTVVEIMNFLHDPAGKQFLVPIQHFHFRFPFLRLFLGPYNILAYLL